VAKYPARVRTVTCSDALTTTRIFRYAPSSAALTGLYATVYCWY